MATRESRAALEYHERTNHSEVRVRALCTQIVDRVVPRGARPRDEPMRIFVHADVDGERLGAELDARSPPRQRSRCWTSPKPRFTFSTKRWCSSRYW
jgi:hypothetical protein